MNLPVARKRNVKASLSPAGIALRMMVSCLVMMGDTFDNKKSKEPWSILRNCLYDEASVNCSSQRSWLYAPYCGQFLIHCLTHT